MRLPSPPRDGQSIAADFRTLIHYLRASRLISVTGGRLKESPNGTTLEILPGAPAATEAADPDHMWKVTQNGLTEEAVPIYQVTGGIVVVQGARVAVAPVTALSGVLAASGFIALKVTRVTNSRAYNPSFPPVIEFSAYAPSSQEYEEFTVLAEVLQVITPAPVAGDPDVITYQITQCRNEELCSYELLLVQNGEFVLLPFQANSRNSYAPPLPTTA